eukprot:1186194-Prorocentrum_minimum.AAC.1
MAEFNTGVLLVRATQTPRAGGGVLTAGTTLASCSTSKSSMKGWYVFPTLAAGPDHRDTYVSPRPCNLVTRPGSHDRVQSTLADQSEPGRAGGGPIGGRLGGRWTNRRLRYGRAQSTLAPRSSSGC